MQKRTERGKHALADVVSGCYQCQLSDVIYGIDDAACQKRKIGSLQPVDIKYADENARKIKILVH